MLPAEGPLTAHEWQLVAPIVDAVLELPEEKREQAIAELCGGEVSLSHRVRALVRECGLTDPLLDQSALERFSSLLEHSEHEISVPKMLAGVYRIQREVGRGGMAVVYLADDLQHSRLCTWVLADHGRPAPGPAPMKSAHEQLCLAAASAGRGSKRCNIVDKSDARRVVSSIGTPNVDDHDSNFLSHLGIADPSSSRNGSTALLSRKPSCSTTRPPWLI